jgi:hypothetical protein
MATKKPDCGLTNHRWTLMNTEGLLGDICPAIRVGRRGPCQTAHPWFNLSVSCFRGSIVGFGACRLDSIFPIDVVPIGDITIQLSWIIIAVAGLLSIEKHAG